MLKPEDSLEHKEHHYHWKNKDLWWYKYKYACLECEKDIWVHQRDLKRHLGRCRSCASRKNINRIEKRKRPFEWLFNRLLWKVRQHNEMVCEISYDDFLTFTRQENCHYCGEQIRWVPYFGAGIKMQEYSGYNLDRKDNTLGYIKDNLVVCCPTCNQIKNSHLFYEEMLRVGALLHQLRQERGATLWSR